MNALIPVEGADTGLPHSIAITIRADLLEQVTINVRAVCDPTKDNDSISLVMKNRIEQGHAANTERSMMRLRWRFDSDPAQKHNSEFLVDPDQDEDMILGKHGCSLLSEAQERDGPPEIASVRATCVRDPVAEENAKADSKRVREEQRRENLEEHKKRIEAKKAADKTVADKGNASA